jgi:hypothetical protein
MRLESSKTSLATSSTLPLQAEPLTRRTFPIRSISHVSNLAFLQAAAAASQPHYRLFARGEAEPPDGLTAALTDTDKHVWIRLLRVVESHQNAGKEDAGRRPRTASHCS